MDVVVKQSWVEQAYIKQERALAYRRDARLHNGEGEESGQGGKAIVELTNCLRPTRAEPAGWMYGAVGL